MSENESFGLWRVDERHDHRLEQRLARDRTGSGRPIKTRTHRRRITDHGNGRYSIANRTTGLVLDGGGNVAQGSITKQWGAGSSPNLQWTFTAL